jgi:hypothetical protein
MAGNDTSTVVKNSEEYAQSLAQVTEAASNANKNIGVFSALINMASPYLSRLTNQVNNLGNVLSSTADLTTKQSLAMSSLTTAVVGSRDAFASVDFDNKSLNTFSSQVSDVVDNLIGSGATLTEFGRLFASVGKVMDPTIKTVDQAGAAFKAIMAPIVKGADNALRLQNAYIHMSAATGSLSDVINRAGPGLENMNELLTYQQKAVNDTAETTQTSIKTVEEYYMQLGQVPGALKQNIISSQNATQEVSMLTATMQFAAGSGRNYADIIDDLKLAYKNMGIEGEPALRFTARMGEMSNRFNVELNVIRDSLRHATEQLRMFGGEHLKNGDIMEGASRIMNNYVSALKSTGISGAAAVGVVQQMTDQIASLDVAQRSFLSQQSGGPGGLRGAFRIERMIREGNIDQVMQAVQKMIQRHTGRIITTREAEQNEAAGSRAIMQRQMLMQGPLGAFAKNEQEAARILEAFEARRTGKITQEELGKTIVQDTMENGVKFQELSATHLGAIRSMMEASRGLAGINALGFLQTTSTYRVGTTQYMKDDAGNVIDTEEENRQYGRDYQRRASARSGKTIASSRTAGTGAQDVPDIIGQTGREYLNNWQEHLARIPAIVKAPLQRVRALIEAGNEKQAQIELKKVQDRINAIREDAKKEKDAAIALKKLQDAARMQAIFEQSQIYLEMNARRVTRARNESTAPLMGEPEASETYGNVDIEPFRFSTTTPEATPTPGRQLRSAAAARAAAAAEEPVTGTYAAPTTGRTPTTTEPLTIRVEVTGYCLDCGRHIQSGAQSAAITPTTK